MFKKKFSQDYYDAVDILIRDKYYDSYMCVLFDMSDTLYSMNDTNAKMVKKQRASVIKEKGTVGQDQFPDEVLRIKNQQAEAWKNSRGG